MLKHRLGEESPVAQAWYPKQGPRMLLGVQHLFGTYADALLHDCEAISLFGKAQRGNAAAETTAHDDEVIVHGNPLRALSAAARQARKAYDSPRPNQRGATF